MLRRDLNTHSADYNYTLKGIVSRSDLIKGWKKHLPTWRTTMMSLKAQRLLLSYSPTKLNIVDNIYSEIVFCLNKFIELSHLWCRLDLQRGLTSKYMCMDLVLGIRHVWYTKGRLTFIPHLRGFLVWKVSASLVWSWWSWDKLKDITIKMLPNNIKADPISILIYVFLLVFQ